MTTKNVKTVVKVAPRVAGEDRPVNQVSTPAYQAPELHDAGKAIELVQGGGGGNYLDANRSRYY
jgi:hypothetical protein